MARFILLLFFHFPWVFILYFRVIKKVKSGAPLAEKYAAAREAAHVITRKSRVDLKVRGTENLLEKDGFIMFSNHQGRYDGIAILASSERPLSFAPDIKRNNVFPINAGVPNFVW